MTSKGPYTPRRRCLLTRTWHLMARPPGKKDSCPEVLARIVAIAGAAAFIGLRFTRTWHRLTRREAER